MALPKLNEIEDIKKEGLSIDLSELEGTKVKIESVDVVETDSKWGKDGKALPKGETIKKPCLLVKSGVLKTVEREGKDDIEIRAQELFPLVEGDDGKIGASTHPDSKTRKFMNKLKVKSAKDIVGKSAIVQEKNGYLKFVY